MLIGRLQRHKRKAIERCRRELSQSGSESVLLDVDQLFDGGTLVMHFLGPVDDVAESITKRIVSEYESIIGARQLAKLLDVGCGPGCGEQDGSGCGSGGCAGCGARAACRSESS